MEINCRASQSERFRCRSAPPPLDSQRNSERWWGLCTRGSLTSSPDGRRGRLGRASVGKSTREMQEPRGAGIVTSFLDAFHDFHPDTIHPRRALEVRRLLARIHPVEMPFPCPTHLSRISHRREQKLSARAFLARRKSRCSRFFMCGKESLVKKSRSRGARRQGKDGITEKKNTKYPCIHLMNDRTERITML